MCAGLASLSMFRELANSRCTAQARPQVAVAAPQAAFARRGADSQRGVGTLNWTMPNRRLRPPRLPTLAGDEKFDGGGFLVQDFWRWAMADLRMNTTRGYLAEFLVARAVGGDETLRVEWAGWDVKGPPPAQTRIEVKAAGYLQSWTQAQPSRPRFGVGVGVPEKAWDEDAGAYVVMPEGRVHVWVFALHTCRDPRAYDVRDVAAWEWWVAPHYRVRDLDQKTAALSTIQRFSELVSYNRLGGGIARARRDHDAHRRLS